MPRLYEFCEEEGLRFIVGLIGNECASPGSHEFYVTDLPAKVNRIGKMFLGMDDLKIELAQLG